MPKDPDFFRDKTIIITGAASGVGRATAIIFAQEGANVMAADLNAEGGHATVETVRNRGGKAHFFQTDVCSRHQVEALVAESIAKFGRVNFLFNCAGSALRRCKFLEIDDALIDKTFDLNLKGTFYAMQAVLPHMLENGKGVIVNVASMSHKRGGPGASVHYAAAKAAVLTMTLGVAREFADRGIRALSISPGPVNTPFAMAANTSPDMVKKFVEDVPMKRMAEPEEIGELVLFMCSDACEFMTADTVYVSGGGGWR